MTAKGREGAEPRQLRCLYFTWCQWIFKFSYLTISAIVSSCQTKTTCFSLLLKSAESVCEVKALMEKMKQLQECRDEEEASQEEMATRFEREKRESMFVCSSGRTDGVCVIRV